MTRTRGRSRSSSCSVRLLSPCCLQHGVFGPKSKTGEGEQPDHCQNSKHPGHVHSTSTWRLFRRPCSPIFSDIGATIEHEQSLSCTRCCQPRTTSRRGQHADREPTLPITRSNRMTNTRDMCLDCLVAARTDLGMNWRRTFSDCFQSVFTAWRSSVSCLPLGRSLECANNHNTVSIGFPKSQDRTEDCGMLRVNISTNISFSANTTPPQPAAAQQEPQSIATKHMHNHQRVFAVERHRVALERPWQRSSFRDVTLCAWS